MANQPDLEVHDNSERHRFEAELADGSVAIAQYRLTTGKIEFTHTKVPPEHEGQGIGSALIHAALCEARARKLKVVATCAFFAAYMKKHEEVQDLLDPSYRKALGLA